MTIKVLSFGGGLVGGFAVNQTPSSIIHYKSLSFWV